jgi:hypothetical protein
MIWIGPFALSQMPSCYHPSSSSLLYGTGMVATATMMVVVNQILEQHLLGEEEMPKLPV